jgi:exonuclease SbcC
VRPLRLEIDGLRSYRAKSTIDFTGRDLCAVVGDTGAGKSSILEAMVFALYGGSTFTKQAGSLVCDARDQMRVALDFQADGSRWRVERVMWHRLVTSKPSSHKLEELAPDGSLIRTISDRNRINPMIEQLIGLGRDAFLKSVLLPQGRFAELLTATPAIRTEILKSIFALEDLELCAEEIRLLSSQASTAMQLVRVRRADLGDDPTAEASVAAGAAARATAALDAIDEVRARMHEAVHAAAAAEARAAEQDRHATAARTVLTSLDSLAARAGYGDVSRDEAFAAIGAAQASILSEIAAARDAESAARDQQRSFVEQLVAREGDGLGQADLVRAQGNLNQLPGLAKRWAAAVRERTELQGGQASLDDQHAKADDALASATASCEAAEATLADERDQTAQAAARLRDAARCVDDAVAALQAEQKAAEVARTRRDGVAGVEAAATAAEAAVRAAEDALRDARDHERHVVTADHAAAVAAQLSPGDSCPVCTSTVPEDFAAPPAPGAVDDAAGAVSAAERDCDERRTTLNKAAAAAERARSEAESCEAAHEEKAVASDAALARLRSLVPSVAPDDLAGRDTPTSSDAGHLLADPVLGLLAAAVRPVDEAPVVAARAQLAAAAAEEQRVRLEREEARRGIARCDADAQGAVEDLMAAAGAVPDRFRPIELAGVEALGARGADDTSVAAYADLDITDPLAAVATELEATRRLEEHRAAAAAAVEEAAGRRAGAEQRQQTEVERPLAAIASALQVAEAKLRDLPDIPDLGAFPGDLEAAALQARAASLSGAAQSAFDAFTAGCSAAGEQAATHHGRVVTTVQAVLTDVVVPEEAVATPAARAQTASTAMEHHEIALRTDAAVASSNAERLAAVAARATTFDAAIAEAAPLVRALETLKGLLSKARFITHVVQLRQLHLLGVATERLREMTGGRYGFTAEFDLLDNLTGRARGADTLSGGEKFLASLALSLAMVEMAGRAGGKIDAIFLDEGFGALDSDSLDEALDLLEAQAADGRLLVVISHIKAVAERIQSVLHVTSDATGASSAYWLTDEQRAAFVHDEAGQAVSGLLA